MSHTSMILSALITMALLLFVAPSIFAINRGRLLRNMALWLAIFLGLLLVYKNFGPGSTNPLFQQPEAMKGMNKEIQQTQTPQDESGMKDNDDSTDDEPSNKSELEENKDPTDKNDFTPPKE